MPVVRARRPHLPRGRRPPPLAYRHQQGALPVPLVHRARLQRAAAACRRVDALLARRHRKEAPLVGRAEARLASRMEGSRQRPALFVSHAHSLESSHDYVWRMRPWRRRDFHSPNGFRPHAVERWVVVGVRWGTQTACFTFSFCVCARPRPRAACRRSAAPLSVSRLSRRAGTAGRGARAQK